MPDANDTPVQPVADSKYRPLPGRLGNLDENQKRALEQYKSELNSENVFIEGRMDDAFLLRFLRARKFNVAKAKEMLISEEAWRKESKVDELAVNFVFSEKSDVDRYYPQYYHKMDIDGRPVYIEQLGKLNFEELYKVTTQERLLQRLIHEYEKFISHRLPACALAVGHPVETSCTILDIKGVSLRDFYRVSDYLKKASSIGQDRYPECMGKFYIINAPWGFSYVWNAVKLLLDEVTVAKIDVLDSKYQHALLKQIPAESLPKEFGGTCECPGGCSLSDAGPWNTK